MYSSAMPVPKTEIPCYVFKKNQDVVRHVAQLLANTIRERNSFGRNAVLGLITGSTPVGVYQELVRMHREDGLDLSRVVVFMLGEYHGIGRDRLQSFSRWLDDNLFRHVNIPEENIHRLDGTVRPDQIEDYCRRYDEAISKAGGIDLMILGIGGNGSIAFNEPFAPVNSRTRLATLDPVTRAAAASDFFDESNVPNQAITVGMGTIFDARKIILMAVGDHKARIVRRAVEEAATDGVPASLLRRHTDVSFLLDSSAAGQLTGVATPWVLGGGLEWTDELIKRAVLWLSEKTGKALLKLDGDDFRSHGLHQLLRAKGPAQSIAHRVFKWMMETIEYHPAGRDKNRVLCFSPHPDDDVISMGGTMIRVAEDGHELHVAYMTSGNIAVFDHDAWRVADLLRKMNEAFGIDVEQTPALEQRVSESLSDKKPGDPDSDEVLLIKDLIRWSEAKAAAKVCGVREDDLHFLDLPFYRTGTIEKRAAGQEDVDIVRACIEKVNPSQIYVAGDLTDPHGTHRVCAWIIFQALAEMREETGYAPEVLLYRGAWQEWSPDVIELAVPLSPRDLDVKRAAIFRHESQKDSALFPGPDDPREFWERAEDRNRATADVYNRLGLPEFFAMEAFVRWDGNPDI